MKAVTDFLPRVYPYLPGCSEPLAVRSLVDSAIAFCEESLVLRQKLDDFSTVAETGAYALDAPVGQQVARVMKVWIDGRQITPVPTEDAIPDVPSQRPYAFYTTRADSEMLLNLFPTPNEVFMVTVEVALRPTRSATTFEDDLWNLWLEPVVTGAIGRVMLVPGNAFSDPATGSSNLGNALMLARKARIEGGFGRVKATVRIAPRVFA